MSDTSRTINHKLNELLSKSTLAKPKLDYYTSLKYALVLKGHILGKDKQEKVNSIVVLAKLLDIAKGDDTASNDFAEVLDHNLFRSLFAIIYSKMSTETYKAVLKICARVISGSIFYNGGESINLFLPLYESLMEYPEVVEIINEKMALNDPKICYNSIMLVGDLMSKALKFRYNGIIVLVSSWKSIGFFSSTSESIALNDEAINDAVNRLIYIFGNLCYLLHNTRFELTHKAHQVILNDLFAVLETSVLESDNSSVLNDYIKVFFSENPRKFVIENFSILLALDLKRFLEKPNLPFRKKFHEELMINGYSNSFPIYTFMNKAIELWIGIFQNRDKYPHIYSSILHWDLLVSSTVKVFLDLWQGSNALLDDISDTEKILKMYKSKLHDLDHELSKKRPIKESLELVYASSSDKVTLHQVSNIRARSRKKWQKRLVDFDANLYKDLLDFVCEQRVAQLVRGSWVFTESYGESNLSGQRKAPRLNNKYSFLLLSPNRKYLYHKEFVEKPAINPSFEEMESRSIKVADIVGCHSSKVGKHVGEDDKRKNKMLISIKGTISYEKITLLGADNTKLLCFYTDTQVMKYNWSDGLKMLNGIYDKGQLSRETEQQIDSLFEIRKNIQMLNLEDENDTLLSIQADSSTDTVDDEDFYDLEELTSITANEFFYKV